MQSILSKTEAMLLVAVLALVAVAAGGPPLDQSALYHEFADQRTLFGIQYAQDVLSNLAFAIAGLTGLAVLWRRPERCGSNMQRAMAMLFFGGLVVVAFGSAGYHLDPQDAGLAVDRYSMVLPMAGLLGLAAAGRISERAGATLGLASIALGLAAVRLWVETANVLPWAVFQFGGLLLLGAILVARPLLRALPVSWSVVFLAYGAAKLLEMNDVVIFEFTHHVVSGHTLKHVAAALAAAPVIAALLRGTRQNAGLPGIAVEVALRWRNA